MFDKSTVDYIALVGELDVWRKVKSFITLETVQDCKAAGMNIDEYIDEYNSIEAAFGIGHDDAEILLEFFDFKFKATEETWFDENNLTQMWSSPRMMYLMRITKRA